MPDTFTVPSTQGFGSRLGNSLKGFVLGPILLIAAIALLWWNEGRALQTIEGLSDASSQVIEAESSGPSPGNDNKLVHVVGPATAQVPIFDLGITFAGQVGVERTAEMYQWKENKKEETEEHPGGSQTTKTTYNYTREWSEQAIDSSQFASPEDHQNPAMPFKSGRFAASDAKLGGWSLDPDTLGKVDYSQVLVPDVPADWNRSGDAYSRGDPAAPKIGDMRVRYAGLSSGSTISVLALQSADGFATFTAKNGYQLKLAATGDRSAAELIESQRTQERLMTWIIRGAGFLLMYAGLGLILSPLAIFAAVVPLLGALVRGVTGVLSLVVALVLSIFVFALAWLAYRPTLAAGLIALALGISYLLQRWISRVNKRPKNGATPEGVPTC